MALALEVQRLRFGQCRFAKPYVSAGPRLRKHRQIDRNHLRDTRIAADGLTVRHQHDRITARRNLHGTDGDGRR